MADFGPLNAKLDEIKTLIVAQQTAPAPIPPAPPVDDQPAVDAVDAKADSIIALLKPVSAPEQPAPEAPAT